MQYCLLPVAYYLKNKHTFFTKRVQNRDIMLKFRQDCS